MSPPFDRRFGASLALSFVLSIVAFSPALGQGVATLRTPGPGGGPGGNGG